MDKLAAYDRWLSKANETLCRLRDFEACWWTYSISHLTFQLVVNPSSGPNCGIMLFGCRSIAGPTRWKPQRLTVGRFSVVQGSTTALPGYRFFVEDPEVGFRTEGHWLGWNSDFDVSIPKEWCLWRPAELKWLAEPGAAADGGQEE